MRDSGRDSGRLEAFSDAVIAIMLTLLSLQLLEFDSHAIAEAGLASALFHQWPAFLAFLLTFLVVGQIWITHHNLWRYIERVDQGLLVLNLLLLLFIAVIPFSARLLSESLRSFGPSDQQVAVGFYAATAFGQAASFNLVLWWARRHGLLSARMGNDLYVAVRRRFLAGPSIYLCAMVADLLSPWLSILSYLGVIALYIWPGPGDLPPNASASSGANRPAA